MFIAKLFERFQVCCERRTVTNFEYELVLEKTTTMVTCPAPETPKNGTLVGTAAPHQQGDILTVQCATNYKVPSGYYTITCRPDGSWSMKTPTCKRKSTNGPTCAVYLRHKVPYSTQTDWNIAEYTRLEYCHTYAAGSPVTVF